MASQLKRWRSWLCLCLLSVSTFSYYNLALWEFTLCVFFTAPSLIPYISSSSNKQSGSVEPTF